MPLPFKPILHSLINLFITKLHFLILMLKILFHSKLVKNLHQDLLIFLSNLQQLILRFYGILHCLLNLRKINLLCGLIMEGLLNGQKLVNFLILVILILLILLESYQNFLNQLSNQYLNLTIQVRQQRIFNMILLKIKVSFQTLNDLFLFCIILKKVKILQKKFIHLYWYQFVKKYH